MTTLEIALSILIGIEAAESSGSTDPRAWQRGRRAAGPLQVTRICCADYNRRNPRKKLRWPDDFLGPTKQAALNNSVRVYRDHTRHFGDLRARHAGRPVTHREIALIWRYGYAACLRSSWSDPEGYWPKVRATAER